MPHVWPLLLLTATAWRDHPTGTGTGVLPAAVSDDRLAGQQNAERDALMQLYNATNGPAWTLSAFWGTNEPVCALWYGVVCDGDGVAIELILYNNSLNGALPTALSNLTNLKHM